MLTKIYVISGFLGAGKTTLIQKLLREAFQNQKVVLIENDFGDISVDAALLKTGSIEVTEINSGCICCSLSGDFIKALRDVLTRFQPDVILIEPSGVGKLSDITKVCSDPSLTGHAHVERKITVVDVKRGKLYLNNFGDFFEDQVKYADVILLSRTQEYPERVEEVCRLVGEVNPHAEVFAKPWEKIPSTALLSSGLEKHSGSCGCGYHQGHEHDCSCEHHHNHDHVCECGHRHNHAAEDMFDTVTIQLTGKFSPEDLQTRISRMEQMASGEILRAKGIFPSKTGYLNLQYLPGEARITPCETKGNMLCVIGRNLNQQELTSLFGEE